MKYIIDLSPGIIEKLKILISQGRYDSVSEFATVAIENQLLIEESTAERYEEVLHRKENIQAEPMNTGFLEKLHSYFESVQIESIQTVSTPELQRIPTDCLWGQYNRILPVKITVRTLAFLLKEGRKNVNLETLRNTAVTFAKQMGVVLHKKDKEKHRPYGNKLSTALPVGKNNEKSEQRFANHFVGYLTRAGRMEGAPAALKFINIFQDVDGSTKVGITKEGLIFASLKNPILDEGYYEDALSEEEVDFFIEHVNTSLEREAKAIRLVLEGIEQGSVSPSTLNAVIKSLSRNWSDNMLNTIRAGLISRLRELRLVGARKRGIRVEYFLTSKGKGVLSKYSSR